MAASVLVDAGFIVALLSRRDAHHRWAVAQGRSHPPPWKSCEAAISETLHLVGKPGAAAVRTLLRRGSLRVGFDLAQHVEPVLRLMEKYADVPMSLADACLVRMSEAFADSMVLTTDADFRVYRRHSRHVVPAVMPG